MKGLSALYLSAAVIMVTNSTPLHAQTSYDLLEKKRCADLFPNMVADYLARSECIGEIDKRIEKQKAAERAAAAKEQREIAARSCVARDIPRMEQLLDDMKILILNDFNRSLNGSNQYKMSNVQSLFKEKYPRINFSIQPPSDNIKDQVLIFKVQTNCESVFHFLANIRADSNDELQWYRLWLQEPPRGYELSWSRLNDWGIDFSAIKKERQLLSVIAQPGQTGWTPDSVTGCKVWNPRPQPNETVTWSGSCINGFVEGYGVITWKTNGTVNEVWKATYKNGRQTDGLAEATYMNSGRLYKGTRENGSWNGKVRITDLKYNLVYDGYMKGSNYNGFGTLIYSNGTKYVGNFVSHNRDGYGSEYDSSGKLIYEGSYVADQKSGAGHLYFPDGDYFNGNFVEGYMNGQGTIYWLKGGSTYVMARMGCAWSGSSLTAFQKPKSQCNLERGMPQ